MQLENKTIVITGVGREGQVGEAVARAVAEQGALAVLVAHRVEDAERAQRRLGARVQRLAGAHAPGGLALEHGHGHAASQAGDRRGAPGRAGADDDDR